MRTIDPNKYNMKLVDAAVMRIEKCLENDHCEETECAYFPYPEDLKELVRFIRDILCGTTRTEG